MSDFLNIADFLAPINKNELNFDQGYKEGTIGFNIKVHDEENFPDMDEADLVLIGCGEQRGNGHHLLIVPDLMLYAGNSINYISGTRILG